MEGNVWIVPLMLVSLLAAGMGVLAWVQYMGRKGYILEAERKANEKADALMREIHHRVKNNFQTVSSLLSLHTRYLKDDHAKSVLWEGQNRIQSMALIHTQLYQGQHTEAIDMEPYSKQLLEELAFSYKAEDKDITLNGNIESFVLPVEKAVPLGLIIHELVLNSFKYAFPDGRKGKIDVELVRNGSKLELTVVDDGAGLPEGMDPLAVKTSYGMRLLTLFALELKGDLEYVSGHGTTVKFVCPFPSS